jgi:hypothetical protein
MEKSTIYNIVGAALAALVILVFGLLAGAAQKKESDETEDKSRKLVTKLNEEIKDLTKENAEKQKQRDDEARNEAIEQAKFAKDAFLKQEGSANRIQQLQDDQIKKAEDIVRLTTKVNELSDETLNSLKSKDSYCYFDIDVEPNNTVEGGDCIAALFLRHEGKYPIKNLRLSLINTDDEADDENINGNDRNDDPLKYNKIQNPFTEFVPILLPNQSLRLRNLVVRNKRQKSFNIFFSADHNFWFQRVLVRDFDSREPSKMYYHSPFISQVYLQDLNPDLNQVYIFETIIKESSSLNWNGGYWPSKNKFNRRDWGNFPLTKSEKEGKLWYWQKLHWNGYYLEKGDLFLRKYLRD